MSELIFNPSACLGGIDSLGRMLPTEPIIRPENKLRQVGLFYFLWCGEHGRHRPYDVSKITAAAPDTGKLIDSPIWGDVGTYHHWGEPFYGYYYSDDEWVIRRHMILFCDAGVDFLFFDTTNAVIYEKNAKIVLKVLQEYHDAGFRIPKVMFYTNTASGDTVERIYNAIYAPKYCPDTWFYFEGKPVIIAKEEECSPEARAFFNIKMSQWPNEPDKCGGWPWMDFTRPQRVFENLRGEEEVINVSVAQHPQLRFGDSVLYGEEGNCGRMYHDGKNDPDEDAFLGGANFGEQFNRAIETDPPVVLVTGWNEWIAGRWPGIPERPIMFVDCADAHYSRDIEMMRGGYFDNYYLQFISYIRRYKGQRNVDTNICYHVPGGDFHRDNDGYDRHYENSTGRNPLYSVYAEKACGVLIVHVTSHKPLEDDRTGCFMQVFITGKGECGGVYTAQITEDNAVLSRVSSTSWVRIIDSIPIKADITDNAVEYHIPIEALPDGELWVKAADSRTPIRRGEDFYDHGDTIPAGRLWFIVK